MLIDYLQRDCSRSGRTGGGCRSDRILPHLGDTRRENAVACNRPPLNFAGSNRDGGVCCTKSRRKAPSWCWSCGHYQRPHSGLRRCSNSGSARCLRMGCRRTRCASRRRCSHRSRPRLRHVDRHRQRSIRQIGEVGRNRGAVDQPVGPAGGHEARDHRAGAIREPRLVGAGQPRGRVSVTAV